MAKRSLRFRMICTPDELTYWLKTLARQYGLHTLTLRSYQEFGVEAISADDITVISQGDYLIFMYPEIAAPQGAIRNNDVTPRSDGWLTLWPGQLRVKNDYVTLDATQFVAEDIDGVTVQPIKYLRWLIRRVDTEYRKGVYMVGENGNAGHYYGAIRYSDRAREILSESNRNRHARFQYWFDDAQSAVDRVDGVRYSALGRLQSFVRFGVYCTAEELAAWLRRLSMDNGLECLTFPREEEIGRVITDPAEIGVSDLDYRVYLYPKGSANARGVRHDDVRPLEQGWLVIQPGGVTPYPPESETMALLPSMIIGENFEKVPLKPRELAVQLRVLVENTCRQGVKPVEKDADEVYDYLRYSERALELREAGVRWILASKGSSFEVAPDEHGIKKVVTHFPQQ